MCLPDSTIYQRSAGRRFFVRGPGGGRGGGGGKIKCYPEASAWTTKVVTAKHAGWLIGPDKEV